MSDRKKYRVVAHFSAVQTIEVDAESGQEAIEAVECDFYVSLCHQCSGELDLGDIYKIEAINAETDEVEATQ